MDVDSGVHSNFKWRGSAERKLRPRECRGGGGK